MTETGFRKLPYPLPPLVRAENGHISLGPDHPNCPCPTRSTAMRDTDPKSESPNDVRRLSVPPEAFLAIGPETPPPPSTAERTRGWAPDRVDSGQRSATAR